MAVNSGLVAQQEMIGLLLDNLPSGFTEAHCALPNQPNTTKNNEAWLRAYIRPQTTVNPDATGGWERTRGLFIVDVLYPKGVGDVAPWTTAEAIKTDIKNTATDNVSLYESHISPVDDDIYYILQIQTVYIHEGTTR